jgi:Tol biopolymer transport system component
LGVFTWSPSDSQIAYWLDDYYESHLQVVDRATGENSRIFSADFYPTQILWSPDERYIAILGSDRDYRDFRDATYLKVIEVETGILAFSNVTSRLNTLVGWLNPQVS